MKTTLGPCATKLLPQLKQGVLRSTPANNGASALTLKLQGAPSARHVKGRLLAHQKSSVELLLAALDRRIIVPLYTNFGERFLTFGRCHSVGVSRVESSTRGATPNWRN